MSAKKEDILESDSTKLSVEQSVSFMKGVSLIINDRLGLKELVTSIGVDFVKGMQQKYNVRKSDWSTMTVYPEFIHVIKNPDVASIPQKSEAYCQDFQDVTPS